MRWLEAAAAGLCLAACGGDSAAVAARQDLSARYAAAERALAAGDLAAAEAGFQALAEDELSFDRRELARYRLAAVALARGDRALSQARLEALGQGTGERAALARYRLAERFSPDAAAREAAFRALAWDAPDSVAADKAVRWVASASPADGGLADAQRAAWLGALAAAHPQAAVADNALWWRARLEVERLGSLAEARRSLHALVAGWPESPLVDDALWLLGAIHLRLQDFAGAAAVYEALGDYRNEHSFFVGSYRSALLDDARLRAGQVRHHGLRDFAGAAAAFERLLADFETSVLRDDAWWGLAQARAAAGDHPGAVAAVDALLAERPDSRFAAQARALRADPRPEAAPARPERLQVSLSAAARGR